MTPPATPSLRSLIARLEQATEGSRELDSEIALSQGWTHQKMEGDGKKYWRKPGVTSWYMRSDTPHYTESVDAALTLVPDGWGIDRLETRDPTRKFHTNIVRLTPHDTNDAGWANYCAGESRGATPALALCIAALRAREAHDER